MCVYVRREQIFEQEANDDYVGPAGERRAMIGLPLAPTLTPGYTLRRRRREEGGGGGGVLRCVM